MALNKNSLGPKVLSFEKGKIEDVQSMELGIFAAVENSESGEKMIAFSTKETPNTYYWASTSLFKFLEDNFENADYDADTLCYSFPEDKVVITHQGKVPVKSDKSKSCNKWKIEC